MSGIIDSRLNAHDELCSDIDFVIPWVDGSDPEWQKSRRTYRDEEQKASIRSNAARYRDWGILPYWFRAVEKYAPWVRKIHFITCGQVPAWLNLNHTKLHFVKHEDYIPHQWLPTFSSYPIELNIHRIDGLSEKFVYFNDDMFLNAPVKPEDFFVNGLPCACIGLNPGPGGMLNEAMGHVELNHLIVIARHFDFRKSFTANFTKWLRLRYGSVLLRTLYMLPAFWACKSCRGFYEPHTAGSYLKQTFTEVWNKEQELLEQTSSHKFRDIRDVGQWLMEYWQIMSGNFHPRSKNFSAFYSADSMLANRKFLARLISDIKSSRHKLICINDNDNDTDDASAKALHEIVRAVQHAYSEVLPDKSAFEL